MADEEHRQEDEAAGAPGGRAAETQAAAQAGGDDAMRAPEAEGDDAADREAAAVDGEAAPVTCAGPGDGAADREARGDAMPPGSEPCEEAGANLEDELAGARRAATENLERALRAQAELENVRRRLERDLQNAHKFALERFVSELLPVKDSLELGLAASAENGASAASIAQGVELTLRMLEQAMEKFGVAIVDPAGEPFDPKFHQAMTMRESDAAESGTVLTVVQKGYLLNERLVRPAMVIVAK